MIFIWKADFEGSDFPADLKNLGKIHTTIMKKIGGDIYGPYLPQDASVMYIFDVKEYEWLNQAGRLFFAEVAKAKLAFVPQRYEVAVTPKEFFGK